MAMPARVPSSSLMVRDWRDPSRARGWVPPRSGDHAELVVADGHAGPVAELLVDGEGLAVPLQRLVVVPPVFGDHAELLVTDGHAGPVAELLVDGEGLAVPLQRLVVVPP